MYQLKVFQVCAAICVGAFCVFSSVPARAVPIVTLTPNPVNFPDTVVGATSTISVDLAITNVAPEETVQEVTGPFLSPPFDWIWTSDCTAALSCTLDVSFSPSSTGNFSDTLLLVLAYLVDNETSFLEAPLDLAGRGISPTSPSGVPLPAALPLFASGLGAMGLLAWRRKRKQAVLTVAA